jgi:hypothetical protein
MSALIPDGYFVDDHLVWGDLGRGGILSRGYGIQFPDSSASDDDAFIELEDNIRKVLSATQRTSGCNCSFIRARTVSYPRLEAWACSDTSQADQAKKATKCNLR